jgi:hypothetical protein
VRSIRQTPMHLGSKRANDLKRKHHVSKRNE